MIGRRFFYDRFQRLATKTLARPEFLFLRTAGKGTAMGIILFLTLVLGVLGLTGCESGQAKREQVRVWVANIKCTNHRAVGTDLRTGTTMILVDILKFIHDRNNAQLLRLIRQNRAGLSQTVDRYKTVSQTFRTMTLPAGLDAQDLTQARSATSSYAEYYDEQATAYQVLIDATQRDFNSSSKSFLDHMDKATSLRDSAEHNVQDVSAHGAVQVPGTDCP
ncbi:MAG TPA: hypothetical protein VG759_29245 [Candidatus Angelobacter sp.]|nr:hypothetical protein [Candidatus Angelobacter sp.]